MDLERQKQYFANLDKDLLEVEEVETEPDEEGSLNDARLSKAQSEGLNGPKIELLAVTKESKHETSLKEEPSVSLDESGVSLILNSPIDSSSKIKRRSYSPLPLKSMSNILSNSFQGGISRRLSFPATDIFPSNEESAIDTPPSSNIWCSTLSQGSLQKISKTPSNDHMNLAESTDEEYLEFTPVSTSITTAAAISVPAWRHSISRPLKANRKQPNASLPVFRKLETVPKTTYRDAKRKRTLSNSHERAPQLAADAPMDPLTQSAPNTQHRTVKARSGLPEHLSQLNSYFAEVDHTPLEEEEPVKWITIDSKPATAPTDAALRQRYPAIAAEYDDYIKDARAQGLTEFLQLSEFSALPQHLGFIFCT